MSVTLHAMSCGSIELPLGFLLDGGGLQKLTIPVPAFVIKHPKGVAVFDTGLEKAFGKKPLDLNADERAVIDELAYVDATASLQPGHDLASHLESADIDPNKVTYLVNSHLHFDHCGGNSMVPNAQQVIQKREWDAGSHDESRAANYFHPHEYDLGHDRLEIDGEYDLFGDGTVRCIPTFGHTPGHQSIIVQVDGGDIVLAADACALCRSLDFLTVPGAARPEQHAQMLSSFHIFSCLEKAGAELVFGHDPDQWRHLNDGSLAPLSFQAVADARVQLGR